MRIYGPDGEPERSDVDAIVHDDACFRIDVTFEDRSGVDVYGAWICAHTCALRDRAAAIVDADRLRAHRATCEAAGPDLDNEGEVD